MLKEPFRKSFWKENIDKPVIAINVSDMDEFINMYLNLEKNLPEDKEGIYKNYEYRLRLLTGLASSNLTIDKEYLHKKFDNNYAQHLINEICNVTSDLIAQQDIEKSKLLRYVTKNNLDNTN